MNANKVGRTHYPALDVLRGFAISIVFLYHTFHFVPIFEFGWMGVDLFFVLSGFLITDLLLASKKQKHFFRNFYMRRFLRVFPLYYLTLFLFFFLSPYFFSHQNLPQYTYYHQNQFWFWTQLQNWLFVKQGLGNLPFLSHFWSLAVEEQFYLFWPIVLFLVKDLKKLRIFVIGSIISVLIIRICFWIQNPNDMVKYYCNTLTRTDSVLMGCLLAILLREGKKISDNVLKKTLSACLLFFALILLSGNSFSNTNPLLATFGYTIVSVFFALILYIFLNNATRLHWIKKLPVLHFIGKISYGIYVFHIPIYFTLSSLLMNWLRHNIGMTVIEALFSIATTSLVVTLVVSSISFYFFEKPILSLKKFFS
jgi:peptidoglycan/LPS O-acetylase OafA/YrhL